MPTWERITYSDHAQRRMRKRHMRQEDVELVLRIGEGVPQDDGTIEYDLPPIRVVIVEREETAHVVTVIRLRKHT